MGTVYNISDYKNSGSSSNLGSFFFGGMYLFVPMLVALEWQKMMIGAFNGYYRNDKGRI